MVQPWQQAWAPRNLAVKAFPTSAHGVWDGVREVQRGSGRENSTGGCSPEASCTRREQMGGVESGLVVWRGATGGGGLYRGVRVRSEGKEAHAIED